MKVADSWAWHKPLEKKMAIHSSILACEIPPKEEPGGFAKELNTSQGPNNNNNKVKSMNFQL